MSLIKQFKETMIKYGLEWFGRYYGTYKGIVVSNEDPDFLGRLQLKVPPLFGDQELEKWSWSVGMFSGAQTGFVALPKPGDTVWVQFENGDPAHPIWMYGWFGDGDMPEEAKHPDKKSYVFQTTDKQRLYFNDEEGFVRIISKAGTTVEINDAGVHLGTETESAEPIVLGDKNFDQHTLVKDEFVSLYQNLIQFCDTQFMAATSTPILSPLKPGYLTLKLALTMAKAIINTSWPDKIEATKSTKNTTD